MEVLIPGQRHSVTVYKARHTDTFRVVVGEQRTHDDAKHDVVTVYPSAAMAYAGETRESIRHAILRIDPKCATPTPRIIPQKSQLQQAMDIRTRASLLGQYHLAAPGVGEIINTRGLSYHDAFVLLSDRRSNGEAFPYETIVGDDLPPSHLKDASLTC